MSAYRQSQFGSSHPYENRHYQIHIFDAPIQKQGALQYVTACDQTASASQSRHELSDRRQSLFLCSELSHPLCGGHHRQQYRQSYRYLPAVLRLQDKRQYHSILFHNVHPLLYSG